jgi:hypothetical protein
VWDVCQELGGASQDEQEVSELILPAYPVQARVAALLGRSPGVRDTESARWYTNG